MAASLMMRTGLPSAFSKLNPTHPRPRCFGSLTILRLRTGEGNPSEIASNSQSATSGLIWLIIAPGVNFRPDLNFLLSAREIISFTFEPPTSITRILFFKIAFELYLAAVKPAVSYLSAPTFDCCQFLDSCWEVRWQRRSELIYLRAILSWN